MGVNLMLPFLPSVMKHAYAATGTPPLRYLQFISSFGVYGNSFFPSDTGLVAQTGGIMARPLSGISGNISSILGPSFSNYKSKISLIRGLSVMAGSNLHNGSIPTCSSGTFEDNEANGRPVFPYSIDDVLAKSSKIYPDPTGKQRNVNFVPKPGSYRNFSWTKNNSSVEHLPNTSATSALLAKFTQLTGTQPVDQTLARKNSVLNGVFNDYKSLSTSSKISANDKMRLESYISLIDEVQRGLASTPVAGACSKPLQETESTNDAVHRNQANILVAAMACQLTRVSSYVLSVPYDPMHDYSHNSGNEALHSDALRIHGQYVAYVMSLMDSVVEEGGTLLSNSILYWGNEYGENNNGDPHITSNLQVFLAGGGAGQFELGQYINYRKTGGRPFSNFLVSIFNAMGLSSSDYERDGVVGFGEYDSGAINSLKFSAYTSSAERRKPLPYLYKGTALG